MASKVSAVLLKFCCAVHSLAVPTEASPTVDQLPTPALVVVNACQSEAAAPAGIVTL